MKRTLWIGLVTIILVVCWLLFCGYQWSWGPFHRVHDLKTASLPGNGQEYALSGVKVLLESPLAEKTIVFLGSSVTHGAASKGISFADYIGARDGCTVVKEAVSGTTLVTGGINSYIARLEKIDAAKADIFVCQLSTNDATQKKPLGSISESFQREDFDTATVAGAIEYIISYASERWNCPIAFYTNPRYDSAAYGQMVDLLLEIQKKWDITVIDLWNDAEFNKISPKQRKLYMADSIHPTQAGYLEWWMPKMEESLYQMEAQQ